jgi:peptidoglycan hydrolase-like protein with peptidoglycan-binding domain
MTKLMRKLMLGAAPILALGIAGVALDHHPAKAEDAVHAASMPLARQTPDSEFLRRDDIRWAQVELRYRGLYKGSLDGVLGPETKHALDQFQKNNGLGRTAALDARTWEALTGNSEIAQGSSMPANDHADPMTNSSASGWGK